jgi:hypothetical protein
MAVQLAFAQNFISGVHYVAYLVDDVLLLYGCEAASRVETILNNFDEVRLEARLHRALSIDCDMSNVAFLESLGLNFLSCLRGCALRFELEFDSWGDEWECDASFSTLSAGVERLHGLDICQDFTNLVNYLPGAQHALRDRVAAVLSWTYGPPGEWFAALHAQRRARPPVSFSSLA